MNAHRDTIQHIRQLRFEPDASLDDRILRDIRSAHGGEATSPPRPLPRVTGHPLAWAAVVLGVAVVVIWVGMRRWTPDAASPPRLPPRTESLADLMTARSFSAAFRQGGFEALDSLCGHAEKLAGPRPDYLSARGTLEDLDG